MTRNHLAQMARPYMEYDMIGRHTDLPSFPEGRIRLLHAVLSHQPAAAANKDMLSVVASLAQMGLDTHDMVDNEPAASRGGLLAMRARQLKVLAGDYFSGRFYNLLAQAGQIEMVRRMGDAICDLNRIKTLFYTKMKQMKLNAEEYLLHGAELKSGLFMAFTYLMTGVYERLWPEAVSLFSRCELLVQELALMEKPSRLEESWGVWHILHEGSDEDRRAVSTTQEDPGALRLLIDKYAVPEKLNALLQQTVSQLEGLLARLPSDKLAKELRALAEPFLNALAPMPATAIKELG